MVEPLREKWVGNKSNVEGNKCPKCREKSEEPVFPFGDDFFFCGNPNCKVLRFRCNTLNNEGYYIETTEPMGTPNVTEITNELSKKRST